MTTPGGQSMTPRRTPAPRRLVTRLLPLSFWALEGRVPPDAIFSGVGRCGLEIPGVPLP